MLSKKTFSLLGLVLCAALVQLPDARAQAPHAVPLHTVRVASGLSNPLFVTEPPGDTSRVFIVEQNVGSNLGQIRIMSLPGNTLVATPYLQVTPISGGGEQGLLGLAFHPDFANNGYFFVYYTNTSGNNQVVRYTANAPFATSTTANPATAMPVMTFLHPGQSNHNGGWIAFGPDNYLYIDTGDGGSGNDPPNNAQNMLSYLGKQHRIDVDSDDFPTDPNKNYHIPATNPFVGNPNALGEIWLYGLRNPWRSSFDRITGDIWIGDVGQGAVEEVDFIPAGVGGLNMGWRCMEGTSCTGLTGCTCGSPSLTPPVQTYTHTTGGCSITGGYRYRGSAMCGWDGVYFYADYCSSQITSFGWNGTSVTNVTNRTSQLAPGGGLSIASITSFGQDANGELYICDQGGEVFKIVPGTIVDCNGNGIHDGCDIDSGSSLDADNNGVPDECQPTVTAYCFGDGSGTPCPCSAGTAGNGCPNSVVTAGAHLGSTGVADLSNDSLILDGSGMPPGSSCMYFQGTTQVGGGNGAVFGDGLRCAAGTVVRLAMKTNGNGNSAFPEILDPLLSVRGGIATGSGPTTRTYQVWYRNAAAFCTPDTFNLTNALSVLWVN